MVWLIRDFPELEHLEPQERAQVLTRVPMWTYPAMLLRAAIPAIFLTPFFGLAAWASLGGVDPSLRVGVSTGMGLACGVLIALWSYTRQLNAIRADMRRFIVNAFKGARPPFCFSCGYDLRNLQGDRCPECGGSLISRPEPVRPWPPGPPPAWHAWLRTAGRVIGKSLRLLRRRTERGSVARTATGRSSAHR